MLVLRPDEQFLADPAVTYPVTVDPTTTLTPNTDTWVATNFPTSQRGSPELKSGTFDGGGTKARSFLKFTMPQAINGADIVDTNLAIFNYHSFSCTPGPVAVRRIVQDWDPDTVTWSTAEGAGQPDATTVGEVVKNESHGYSGACPEDFINFDTDAIVQFWADNPGQNYGFKIRAPDETDSFSWHRFHSANHVTGVGSTEPKLTVTYNSYPATATGLSASPTVIGANGLRFATSETPTLTGKVADADGGNVRVDFELWTDPAGAAPLWSGSKSNVQQGTATSITVPAGVLSGFGDFQWRARGFDGSLFSKNWSAWQRFRLNTGKPAAPTVDCPDYPPDTWSPKAPAAVTCTLDTTAADGAGYYWNSTTPPPITSPPTQTARAGMPSRSASTPPKARTPCTPAPATRPTTCPQPPPPTNSASATAPSSAPLRRTAPKKR
ncbi:MAG: DNRLRE domain-containing protein [Micromonosporaceae bacterium]